MPIIVIYAEYNVDNEDWQPVDGEEYTRNTEYVVKNIEQDEIEAAFVTVLAEVEEGKLSQEQQHSSGPASKEGQEGRLPAPVEIVLFRKKGCFTDTNSFRLIWLLLSLLFAVYT